MDSLYPGISAHHHLPSVAQGRHHHQDRRLLPLKTGLDVDSIHPHVHHFQVIQGPSAPLGKLIVPLILQPGYRARRYRCLFSQQSPHRQVEVTFGKAM